MSVRENFSKYRTSLTLVAIIIACSVSLGISTDSLRVTPKEVGQSVVAVFQQAAFHIGDFFSRTVTSVRELSALRDEYGTLLQQVREYERVADDITSLEEENERLRQALGFAEASELASIPVRVIGKEPGNFFTALTINKGRSAGITRDMPVVANVNGMRGLVGRVTDTGLTTSTVMPLFDIDSFVAARLQRSRYEGLVSGEGAGSGFLVMQFVDKSARRQVASGDLVITSGMRSIFPEGIVIGIVETIQGKSYETSLHLQLRPIVEFGDLEYAFVVKEAQK